MAITIKYKKGNVYQHTDNSAYSNKKEYEPTKQMKRIFNEKTEQFEYKEEIIDYKRDWENEMQMLEQLHQIEKEIKK